MTDTGFEGECPMVNATPVVLERKADAGSLILDLKRLSVDAKGLARSAGKNLYLRVSTAAALLQDGQYLEVEHGGSSSAAADHLHWRFFSELCGSVRLTGLLVAFDFVGESEWEELGFDLRKIMDRAFKRKCERDRRDRTRHTRPPAAILREAEVQLQELSEENIQKEEALGKSRREAAEANRRAETSEEKIRRLEQRCAELEAENAQLKALVDRLQKKLSPR